MISFPYDYYDGRTMGLHKHNEAGSKRVAPRSLDNIPFTMLISIDERLTQAEESLLRAADTGGSAFTSLVDELSRLLTDIDGQFQSESTKPDDRTMASRAIASWRILKLSEQLLDIQTTAETMFSSIQTEVEDMFARIGVDDARANSPRLSHHRVSPQSRRSRTPPPNPVNGHDSSGNSLYIESACLWLLNNLHNPYPSKEARISIARTSGSEAKVIDAWFVDARRRIGWNALRKDYFSNKRVDIVDAANRFFLRSDEKCPLDANVELRFTAIEKRAKDLSSDRFAESPLALKLDFAVKDWTPGMDQRCGGEREQSTSGQSKWDALAAASYPSPAISPSRTPEPFENLPSDDIPHMAGQKRRSSPLSLTVNEDMTSREERNKRIRYAILPSLIICANP